MVKATNEKAEATLVIIRGILAENLLNLLKNLINIIALINLKINSIKFFLQNFSKFKTIN